MELKLKEKVLAELKNIVGTEYVSNALPDLYSYSQDMTENEPSWPDFVVMPATVNEVQEVIRLANREKVPVTPYVAGTNVGGLTIPLKGGISLDLRRMDRVIELNDSEMYLVVEPGVTYGHLRRYLDENCPQLTYSYPFAPPYVSVLANALLWGMGDLSVQIGLNSDNINGLEVVLPTGELVTVGSRAVVPNWYGRAPLPDIAGLFIGWEGATGVATKIAIQLWPKPKYSESMMLMTHDMGKTFRFARRMASTYLADEIMINPYDVFKVVQSQSSGPFERSPTEPQFMVQLRIVANSEDELLAKAQLRDTIIGEEFKNSQVMMIPTPPSDYPTRDSIHLLGAATWVATYGPHSNWEEATEKAFQLFDKYQFPRNGFFRPLRGGHFGMWLAIVAFNKGNAEEVERVHGFMREGMALALDMGYLPYKAPHWAVRMMEERADPNWVELLRRVKKMLDPNNIMNPGRYGAFEE